MLSKLLWMDLGNPGVKQVSSHRSFIFSHPPSFSFSFNPPPHEQFPALFSSLLYSPNENPLLCFVYSVTHQLIFFHPLGCFFFMLYNTILAFAVLTLFSSPPPASFSLFLHMLSFPLIIFLVVSLPPNMLELHERVRHTLCMLDNKWNRKLIVNR